MAKKVAIANQKGGTGKTTTAVMLGAILARKHGYRVLLIDLDPQSNMTECLMDPLEVGFHIGHVLLGAVDIESAIYQCAEIPNLFFIPSKPEMLVNEYRGYYLQLWPYTLRERLRNVEGRYDYIIFDCPPNLLHFTKNALCAADFVIIPLEPEPLAVSGFGELVTSILPEIGRAYNPRIDIGGMLFIHRAPRTRRYLPEYAREQVEAFAPGKLFKTEIRLDLNLAKMPLMRKPANIYAGSALGVIDYERFVDEFIARIPP